MAYSEALVPASAQRVLAVTASAWRVAGLSAHALARRAPRGYVPARVARRQRTRAAAPAGRNDAALRYSW